MIEDCTSQPMVVVVPTAAMACVPRVPTMAVSIYWTADCMICSSMVGHASSRIVRRTARASARSFVGVIVYNRSCEVSRGKAYVRKEWLMI